MPRPRFVPGSKVLFELKQRPGVRDLSEYVATRLAVPESWVAPLLAQGRIATDGKTAVPGESLDMARTKIIEVALPDSWPPHMAAVRMELSIIYEDDFLVGINKPPGIVVHPARGHLDNQTLLNGIRHRYRDQIGRDGITISAPHRLDKDTSGVIVFARTRDSYTELVRQFSSGEVYKEYFSLVDGRPDFSVTTVSAPLGLDRENPKRGAVVPLHEGGKTAHTDVYILESGADWGWVRAVPATGRAHQIRLHMAYLQLPVMGDKDYNHMPEKRNITRQALHAARLEITHPATGKKLRLDSPLPPDMAGWLEALRRERDCPA